MTGPISESTDKTYREISRYVLNGIAATIVHYIVFYALYRVVGVSSAALANAVGAVVGITVSYLGSRYFVFPDRRGKMRSEIARFSLLYMSIAAINAVIMWMWTDWNGFNYNAGFCISVIVQTFASFLGNKYLVFNNN